MNKKLKKTIEKTSNYLFGTKDYEDYERLHLIREFYGKEAIPKFLRYLRRAKIEEKITKNTINILECTIAYKSVTNPEFCNIGIISNLGLELLRYVGKILLDQNWLYNDIKEREIKAITHQSLDEIMQEHSSEREGEEWKE